MLLEELLFKTNIFLYENYIFTVHFFFLKIKKKTTKKNKKIKKIAKKKNNIQIIYKLKKWIYH